MNEVITPLVRPSGKDYSSSAIGSIKAADLDLKDAEFDLRALIANPNAKVSDDNRMILREYIKSLEETIRKIKVESEL